MFGYVFPRDYFQGKKDKKLAKTSGFGVKDVPKCNFGENIMQYQAFYLLN